MWHAWLSTTFLIIVVDIMTLGLPQVSKLLLVVSMGMLSVKHPAQEILMAVIYCRRQLSRRLWLAAPAYHKKDSATQHPVAFKHMLHYDRRALWGAGWYVKFR